MREIKFRARHNGRWLDWDEMQACMQTGWGWEDFQDVYQYIGLHDIKNKEIYGGDIVKDISGEIYYVQWNPPYFACYRKGLVEGSEYETHFCDLSAEVIGDGYETPELMNKCLI